MWRSTPAAGRSRPRRWRRAISFRHAISNRFCRRWCAKASCAAYADRTAATSSRASTAEDADDPPLPNSALVNDVVKPALVEAERTFSSVLGRISVEDMAKRAQALKSRAHAPEKLVLDLIGDGYRFSDKVMRKQNHN